jgi:outer membrane protein assembly factor BamB
MNHREVFVRSIIEALSLDNELSSQRNKWTKMNFKWIMAGFFAITFSNSGFSQTVRWPAFLGAGASGIEANFIPSVWNPSENTRWTAELPGHGQSSPVVWGQLLFVTSVEGPLKDDYHVTCLDVANGKPLWHQRLKNSAPVENSYYVSRSAPTPVVDSDRLVVFFESGDCTAFDHDGGILWSRNLSKELGPFEARFGLGASPCQTDKMVFILVEHDGPSFLIALDKATGETRWKAERSPRQSWSSPAIIMVDDQPQVVISSLGSVDGYAAESGQLLWSFSDVGGNTGVTPIDCGDGQFLIGASPGRQGEHTESARQSNAMMKIVKHGEEFSLQRLWIAAEATPSWASPIVHQGLAYWINRVGVIYCFDASTGDNVYTKRTKQSCWATPLALGDRIYFFGKDGLCTVISAGRDFEVIAENSVWQEQDLLPDELPSRTEESSERQSANAMFSGPTVYGYAIAGDRLMIRIGKQIFCIAQ